MNDQPAHFVAVFGAGLALGFLYFIGLWYTIRIVTTARASAPLLLLSWLVRTSVLLTGIWLSTAGQWQRVAMCMCGILLARFFVVQAMKPDIAPTPKLSGSLATKSPSLRGGEQ